MWRFWGHILPFMLLLAVVRAALVIRSDDNSIRSIQQKLNNLELVQGVQLNYLQTEFLALKDKVQQLETRISHGSRSTTTTETSVYQDRHAPPSDQSIGELREGLRIERERRQALEDKYIQDVRVLQRAFKAEKQRRKRFQSHFEEYVGGLGGEGPQNVRNLEADMQDAVKELTESVQQCSASIQTVRSEVANTSSETVLRLDQFTTALQESKLELKRFGSIVERNISTFNASIATCVDATSKVNEELSNLLTFKEKAEERIANLSSAVDNRAQTGQTQPPAAALVAAVQDAILGKLGPVLRWMDNTAREKGIGSTCNMDAECWIDYSECRESKCRCTPGRSYDAVAKDCVKSCRDYGDQFQEVQGHYIVGNNRKFLRDKSLEQCKWECVRAERFVCKTADYFVQERECYLQTVTKLEVPHSKWKAYRKPAVHVQRDCLVED